MENAIFEEKKVSKAYMKLSLPLVLSMTVSLIYNLADTFFVAQTQNTNIVAGVSLCAPLFTTLMALGNIFGQGGSSLISRLLGKNDTTATRRVSAFCFWGAILIGVLMGFIMLLFRTPLLYVIGANEETFNFARDYYTWLAIGAPALVLSFIHSNLLRSEGMSKESMIGTMGGAIVNILLDPIFISVLGLNAGGAAIASVIGYIFSDVYFAVVVAKKSKVLTLDIQETRIPADHVKDIFAIGIPAAVVNIMSSVSAVLVNQFLLPYGNEKIAAMGIALKVSMIVLLLLTGFSFGGQPLFGYYYGAGDKQRFGKLFHFCLKFISGLALALSAVVFILAKPFMRIFMDNETIIADGALMLRLQVVSMVFVGVVLLMTILFQATGKAVGSSILSVSRQGIVFMVVLFVAANLFGCTGVLFSQAVADFLSAILAVVLFKKLVYKEIFE